MNNKPLKLYVIKNAAFDYDTYDGHVVSTYDEPDAFSLVANQPYGHPSEPTITLIADTSLHERGIVLASFNAG